MSNIDTNQIENDIATLATNLLKNFAQQGINDGKAFLADAQADLVELVQDNASGAITQDDYDDGMADIRALARMDSLKEQGLAEATIDQFTSGVIDIVCKAALAAIP